MDAVTNCDRFPVEESMFKVANCDLKTQEIFMSEKSVGYSAPTIEGLILILRGQKVILDADLARIYGVPTKALNQAVKRNANRFPLDFAFQLTGPEVSHLRSQFVTSNQGRGGRRYRPYAFTEHGAIMAANVLNSRQAVKMSVFVVRAFVRLRDALALHKDLARKLEALEKKVGVQDSQIQAIFDALRQLIQAPEKPKRRIGFTAEEKKAVYK
jgi:hypothetical protein